jgi:deazaflavin-dependent oxidoreductase (nitroreductase family)
VPLTGDYERSPDDWAANQAEKYEASGGTEANTLRGVPVVILTTKGRRSGNLRKSPLMRVEHEGTYAVIASQGGAPKHPGWYHNLVAEPRVMLQDGPEAREMQARVATGDERETWWSRATEVWPDYDKYQTKTDRQIPVVLVEPV